MPTSAQLIDRYPGVVDLAIKNRPAAASYVVAAALTLDAAYAGATAMVTVPKGTTYRSPRLQRNRKNLVEETFRGLTRVSYDPTDFAAAAIPGDNAISFGIAHDCAIMARRLQKGVLVKEFPGATSGAQRSRVSKSHES